MIAPRTLAEVLGVGSGTLLGKRAISNAMVEGIDFILKEVEQM